MYRPSGKKGPDDAGGFVQNRALSVLQNISRLLERRRKLAKKRRARRERGRGSWDCSSEKSCLRAPLCDFNDV
jgi:hypothetical protein